MLDGGIIHVANLNAIIVNADAIGKNSPKFLLLVGPVSVHQQVGQMQALRRPFGYVLRRAQDDDWAIGVVGQKQNRLGPGTAQGLPVLPQDNWLLDDIIPPAQNNLTTDANPVQSLLNAIPSGDRRDLARLRETRQWNEEEQAKKTWMANGPTLNLQFGLKLLFLMLRPLGQANDALGYALSVFMFSTISLFPLLWTANSCSCWDWQVETLGGRYSNRKWK
jgi:hypothetical protein